MKSKSVFSLGFSFVNKWMSRKERHDKFGGQPKKYTNVFVKNFGEDMDDERFRILAEEFGKIQSLKVMTDEYNKSKGFGFVSFETPEEAQKVGTISKCLNYEMSHKVPSIPRCSSYHFIFHRKYACFE